MISNHSMLALKIQQRATSQWSKTCCLQAFASLFRQRMTNRLQKMPRLINSTPKACRQQVLIAQNQTQLQRLLVRQRLTIGRTNLKSQTRMSQSTNVSTNGTIRKVSTHVSLISTWFETKAKITVCHSVLVSSVQLSSSCFKTKIKWPMMRSST